MYPTLLKLGPFEFHAYAVFLSVGFLTAVLLIIRDNFKREKPWPITPLGGLWVFLGGFLGARLYYIIQYQPEGQSWYHAFYLWGGGLVFYGGAIGGFIGGLIYVWWKGAPVVKVGDLAMGYVPLAHAIARVGCFLNGCCWGAHTKMPWGVSYPHRSLPWRQHLNDKLITSDVHHSLPVHPTQLYETGSLLLIFVALRLFYRRPHPPGAVMLAYLFLYGFARFIIESFRGDSTRHVLAMTASQYVALGMMAAACAIAGLLWVTAWRNWKPADGETTPADTAEPTGEHP